MNEQCMFFSMFALCTEINIFFFFLNMVYGVLSFSSQELQATDESLHGTRCLKHMNSSQAYVTQMIFMGRSKGVQWARKHCGNRERKGPQRKSRLWCMEKKVMERFPSRELAEKRLGAVTENHNSSITHLMQRKTSCYILFLNEDVCIIRILYFLISWEEKKIIYTRPQFGSKILGQTDKTYLSSLVLLLVSLQHALAGVYQCQEHVIILERRKQGTPNK